MPQLSARIGHPATLIIKRNAVLREPLPGPISARTILVDAEVLSHFLRSFAAHDEHVLADQG